MTGATGGKTLVAVRDWLRRPRRRSRPRWLSRRIPDHGFLTLVLWVAAIIATVIRVVTRRPKQGNAPAAPS